MEHGYCKNTEITLYSHPFYILHHTLLTFIPDIYIFVI
jgi:hypothetical protein